MNRGKPQGRAHREMLRRVVVPQLRAGSPVPCAAWLGLLLAIHPSEAARHMQRVLDEDGFTVAWLHGGKRKYIVEIGRLAA